VIIVSGGNVSVTMVADNQHQLAVQWGVFLAKHDFEADFGSNGLARIESNADTTALPVALVNLAGQALKAAGGAGALLSGTGPSPSGTVSLQIFDVGVNPDGTLKLIPLLTQATPLATVQVQAGSGVITQPFAPLAGGGGGTGGGGTGGGGTGGGGTGGGGTHVPTPSRHSQ
jgi:uncharacterized membrane protein YgcG